MSSPDRLVSLPVGLREVGVMDPMFRGCIESLSPFGRGYFISTKDKDGELLVPVGISLPMDNDESMHVVRVGDSAFGVMPLSETREDDSLYTDYFRRGYSLKFTGTRTDKLFDELFNNLGKYGAQLLSTGVYGSVKNRLNHAFADASRVIETASRNSNPFDAPSVNLRLRSGVKYPQP